ncbi:MAG: hypothetical protein ABII90_08615 [Bacteroidota bacterium]
MKYNPDIHKRKNQRLKEFDYSTEGAYFVTIVSKDREHLFGKIEDNKIILNDAGKMVFDLWIDIPKFYNSIETDEFIVMPNHLHGILFSIETVGAPPRGRPQIDANLGRAQGPAPTRINIPSVIGHYKFH